MVRTSTRNEGARHMVTHPPPVVERARCRVRDRGGRGRGGRGSGGRGRRGRYSTLTPNLPTDLNAPTQRLRYHAILVRFMSYTKKEEFGKDRVFTE